MAEPRQIILMGPVDGPEWGVALPYPEWGDSVEAIKEVAIKKTMSNDTFSYVTDSGQKKITLRFKGIHNPYICDLIALIHNCKSKFILYYDHHGNTWRVKFSDNIELTLARITKASNCDEYGENCECVARHNYDFTLELVGCVM